MFLKRVSSFVVPEHNYLIICVVIIMKKFHLFSKTKMQQIRVTEEVEEDIVVKESSDAFSLI